MTQQSMDTFLKTLSSSAPVPGGGGASAYVAAVGMSLGSMVANLTRKNMPSIRKKLSR